MAQMKTPVHVVTAMVAARSAWQRRKSGMNSLAIVLSWYLSVVRKGQIPHKKVLLFVGDALRNHLSESDKPVDEELESIESLSEIKASDVLRRIRNSTGLQDRVLRTARPL